MIELHMAFEEAVDDYLETCKKTGKSPQKTYSGQISLRISPEVHASAAMIAEASGKSLNTWLADLVSNTVHNN